MNIKIMNTKTYCLIDLYGSVAYIINITISYKNKLKNKPHVAYNFNVYAKKSISESC